MTSVRQTLDLGLQGSIELVGVNLLILEELVILDALTELLRREEIIVYAILLGATWLARGAADAKSEVKSLSKQMTDEGRLATAAGSRKYH